MNKQSFTENNINTIYKFSYIMSNLAKFKLYLKVEDEELKELYKDRVEKWNKSLTTEHPDSGFDLLSPEQVSFISKNPDHHLTTQLVDLKVKAAVYNTTQKPCPYTLNVRSSIYKTPFRLANNVGIIDSGYRGNLMAAVDCHDTSVEMQKHNRYFQICMPTLEPFEVEIVESLDKTTRGEGGHGSTGN